MKERYIYLHINPSDGVCFYVGKGTANPAGKTADTVYHRAYAYVNRNSDWHKIVNAHGFIVEIAEGGIYTDEEASEAEKRWVNEHWDSGRLVNRTRGGCGISGYVFPRHIVERLVALRRPKISGEHSHCSRPLYAYAAKTGKLIARFVSHKAACDSLCINAISIAKALRRPSHHAAEYLFYAEDQGPQVEPVLETSFYRPQPVCQLDKSGQVLRTFPTIKDAGVHSGTPAASISNCCWGKQKTAGGFRWRFASVTAPSPSESRPAPARGAAPS
jgi:hypothetical protein